MATEINPPNRDLAESVAAVRDGVKSFIDKGSERASDFKDRAAERASDLKDRAAGLKDSAMTRGKDAYSAMERLVEERPLAVIGGVFVGGLIIGMWLRR